MALILKEQVVPLEEDRDGVYQVAGTRIRLDTIVYAFNQGLTAEEIVSQYPVLDLADVYTVIAYYLKNRPVVDAYLQRREEAAATLRAEIEAKPGYKAFRESILARQQRRIGGAKEAIKYIAEDFDNPLGVLPTQAP
ncbi:MAG: DUF433 domain-containing protein [Chloroflexi bacterium]|nr:DUF433 domain-containing protein [Chloroflexota bacterium]MCI0577211.1 DUF433 domain-containing protein [Chloroflexota bacterium]MCI0729134.1 DUF433 domain-containing protein [Chloroflexota bacterium]